MQHQPVKSFESNAVVGALRDVVDPENHTTTTGIASGDLKIWALLEATNDSVFTLDRDFRFTFLNDKAREYIGASNELIGVSVLDVIPGARGSEFVKASLRVLEQGGSERVKAYFPPLDRWFEASFTAVDEGITVFFRDITRFRKTELQLRTSLANQRRELEAVLDGLPEMVWSAFPDGTSDYSNKQWYDFTGITPDVADKAAAFVSLVHPDDLDGFLRARLESHA